MSNETRFLGSRLGEIRKQLGCGYEQFAKYLYTKGLNVSYSTLFNWENECRTPKVSDVSKLSDIFGVSIGYFFDQKINKPNCGVKNETSS